MAPRGTNIQRDRARALRRSMTDSERHLWAKLRRKQLGGLRFRRQVPFGPYVADFVCLSKRLIIEIDGGQHDRAKLYDARRTTWMEEKGFKVIRFWAHDVMKRRTVVLQTILSELRED